MLDWGKSTLTIKKGKSSLDWGKSTSTIKKGKSSLDWGTSTSTIQEGESSLELGTSTLTIKKVKSGRPLQGAPRCGQAGPVEKTRPKYELRRASSRTI